MDITGLARLFTAPGLLGEFVPSSLWQGVDMGWREITPVRGAAAPLVRVFGETVAALCADHETVAVSVSGGLDSLAVLWHVVGLRPKRRVLAFTVDLVDDAGQRTADLVRRRLSVLGLADRVRLTVLEPRSCRVRPQWSPVGPCLDALPLVNATLAGRAAEDGAGIMLSGDGADELLATPRHAAVEVARWHGARAGIRYLRDACAGTSRLEHLLAASGPLTPAPLRMRMYWALNWPEWCDPAVSPVLAPRWRTSARDWARGWVDATIHDHVTRKRSWAEADAYDTWWPRAFRPPTGALPEASPFTEDAVVAAALALPLGARYAPSATSAYLRVKGQVTGLFPAEIQPLLPRSKHYYAAALAQAAADPIPVPEATRIGVLDEQAVARCRDPATRMTVAAVEEWLAGARRAGAVVTA